MYDHGTVCEQRLSLAVLTLYGTEVASCNRQSLRLVPYAKAPLSTSQVPHLSHTPDVPHRPKRYTDVGPL